MTNLERNEATAMTTESTVKKLTQEILCGRRIKREDDLSLFLEAPPPP